MKEFDNISAQKISWVKSNKQLLESRLGIRKLYFPESLDEFKDLIMLLNRNKEQYDIIGYSSNTLFLPSYTAENVVCTKYINTWTDTEDAFVCDCGVAVSKIAKYAVEHGYKGFEGLTDLPGTVAAGIYGNCGCRGCSVNNIVDTFTLITTDNQIIERSPQDIGLAYRSTSLKRNELQGVILQIKLKRNLGDAGKLIEIAHRNHSIRKATQPSGVNNLGTTFNGCTKYTVKGFFFILLEKIIQGVTFDTDRRKSFPLTLRLIGQGKFAPYIYYPNRYMFLDAKAHLLFEDYIAFLKTLYLDSRLEIEIKK